MRTHELKCWPEPFEALLEGRKVHEYRKDDRRFGLGDILWLREFVPAGTRNGGFEDDRYTGRETRRLVTYVSRAPFYGIPDGYVVMSLRTP